MSKETRPQHPLPTTARGAGTTVVPVKVRITGTPSAADLDRLTQTVARAVGRQLRAVRESREQRSTTPPASRFEVPGPAASAPADHEAFVLGAKGFGADATVVTGRNAERVDPADRAHAARPDPSTSAAQPVSAAPGADKMRRLLQVVQADSNHRAQPDVGDPRLRPPLGPVGVAKHAQWQAEEQLRVDGPDNIFNPRYRWQRFAEVMRGVVARAQDDPATYLAVSRAVAELYIGAYDETRSLNYTLDREQLRPLDLAAADVAELDRIFRSTGLAPQDIPVRDWYFDDGTGRAAHGRNLTEREAVRLERGMRAQQQAAIHAQARELIWGLLYALAGVKRGSASAHLVVPRPGAASGLPGTYPSGIGPRKDAAQPFAGLVPPRPGEVASYKGFQRELFVAQLEGGRLARSGRVSDSNTLEDLVVPFGGPGKHSGKIAIDVLGRNGELILVGGPGKGANPSAAIQRAADLKLAAAERGVDGVMYFTRDTPKAVLDGARKHLGNNNVRLFDDPVYREPPR